MRLETALLFVAVVAQRSRCFAAAMSPHRNVEALSDWAKQQGVTMHDSVQWKNYASDATSDDEEESNNWGLELKEPVQAGTVLLRVPNSLVLDSNVIREEMLRADENKERLKQALEALGDFCGPHEAGFLIFCKLLRCRNDPHSRWTPWIQAMPQTFTEFSPAERECLPFYARYAAEYQEKKFEAFCQAAKVLFGEDSSSDDGLQRMKWAFGAVGSRFWKNAHNSELCPIGDMFNHREPPNVSIIHDGESVNFVYKGNKGDGDSKDLYITYGQPSNPHRFLGIFGFVPTDMPEMWSHIAYPDNPFTANVPKMTFRVADGFVPKIVWDAVLYALMQPDNDTSKDSASTSSTTPPTYTTEQHAKYRKYTTNVLQTHVANQLEELAGLRAKIETTKGDNMDLIRTHNEFLTTVFSRVKAYLEKGEPVVEEPVLDASSTATSQTTV